jgi:hypothetical protein
VSRSVCSGPKVASSSTSVAANCCNRGAPYWPHVISQQPQRFKKTVLSVLPSLATYNHSRHLVFGVVRLTRSMKSRRVAGWKRASDEHRVLKRGFRLSVKGRVRYPTRRMIREYASVCTSMTGEWTFKMYLHWSGYEHALRGIACGRSKHDAKRWRLYIRAVVVIVIVGVFETLVQRLAPLLRPTMQLAP